ncbi:MAG: ribosome biogenesis GTPase Der [Kiritimatiellae bacterium]|nr:ribosome biogenesis GTPase Der [Kiritimatiellia bacterium]
MSEAKNIKSRVVAIVGRPNVGKSAIFNRIAGKRIAIVHDESGVTRDRLMQEVSWSDQRFSLIDTGGVAMLDGESQRDKIEAGIRTQVDIALGDAAAVILVVDVQQGVHALDQEVAGIVRKRGIPCVVAVNKCDLPERDEGAEEFARLGFTYFPVAAQHNRGMGELMGEIMPLLPQVENETEKIPLKVAVVGRPNAGKSSYINRLLRNQRVIVSDVAGTTRDSIEVPFTIGKGAQARHYTFIDTAGMRNRHKVESSVERFSLFRAEKSVEEADVVVLVMDPDFGPTGRDKHIASLIQKHEKGCVIIMNKWDLALEKGITQTQAEPAIRQMMSFMDHCPIVFTSTVSGLNVRKSIEVIDIVSANIRVELPTGMLNRTIKEAMARVSAPRRGGKGLKVYYAVQVGKAPIRIRLFVNNKKLMPKQYQDFLIRSLRERFGLEGAPVILLLKERDRPDLHERLRNKAAQAQIDANSEIPPEYLDDED